MCGDIIPEGYQLCSKCWVVSEKPKEKILIEMDINAVPSEMTARVMLRLIENYCRQYGKRLSIDYGSGKLDFEDKSITAGFTVPNGVASKIIDKVHKDTLKKKGRGLL